MDNNYKTNRSGNFDPTNFNSNFIKNDKPLIKSQDQNKIDKDIIILPHKQPLEKIIIDIRDLIFKILEKLEGKENPIPFIFANEERKFYFSVLLILFGSLFLLLSTLMKS
jgi:hypothetical protein